MEIRVIQDVSILFILLYDIPITLSFLRVKSGNYFFFISYYLSFI